VRVRRERDRTLLTERGFFVCLLSKVNPDFDAGSSTSSGAQERPMVLALVTARWASFTQTKSDSQIEVA
jgi:hypothetical protein